MVKTMKAVAYYQYGSPDELQMVDIPKPTPNADEVLLKVHATALNAYDWRMLRAEPFIVRLVTGGLLKPSRNILGIDVAGRIEAVGSNITQFQPGDEVFGDISATGKGGMTEYIALPEKSLALKSPKMTFEEAAAFPMASVTTLQGLRDGGKLQPGQSVLINGASGGVGTFAVQIAKALGAEVTAVCSTSKMELARELGADFVIDYTQEDFTQNGKQYDVIYAANGYQPLAAYQRALKPSGYYVMVGGNGKQFFEAILLGGWMSRGGQKMGIFSAKPSQADLEIMRGWFDDGKVKPIIDSVYPLSEAADAVRYLERGHARGKLIIQVAAPI